MQKFKTALQEKLNKVTPKLKDFASSTYNQIKDMPKNIIPIQQQLFPKQASEQFIIEITPRIFWMAYPSEDKIQRISKHLNQKFANNYYIWNISEHTYPSEWFQNQVAVHSHPGYSCPSLFELLTICKNILIWLSSDSENVALVNCQQTKGRSVLVISSLISLMGAGHPGECLIKVCQLTQIHDYQALFPSQHLYLTYVGNLLNGLKLNNQPLRLVSVIFQGIPEVIGEKFFKPYFQLFKDGQIIYNSLTNEVKSYESKDLSCIFETGGIELSDDILVRCKHFKSNTERLALFRLMFNCSFVFQNVLRVWGRELDQSNHIKFNEEFFIDFIFERGMQMSSQSAQQQSQQPEHQQLKSSKSPKENNFLLYQIVTECKAIILNEPKVKFGLEYNFSNNIEQKQVKQQQEDKPKEETKKNNLQFTISEEPVKQESSSLISKQLALEEKQKIEVVSQVKQESVEENKFESQQMNQISSGRSSEERKMSEEGDPEEIVEQDEETRGKKELVNKLLSGLNQQHGEEDDDDKDIDEYLSQLEQQ